MDNSWYFHTDNVMETLGCHQARLDCHLLHRGDLYFLEIMAHAVSVSCFSCRLHLINSLHESRHLALLTQWL